MGSDAFKEIVVSAYCNNNIDTLTQSIRHDLTLALHDSCSIALLIMENELNFLDASSIEHVLSISVWVLKTQEEEGCWTKLYTMPIKPPSPYRAPRPLELWKNNDEWIICDFTRGRASVLARKRITSLPKKVGTVDDMPVRVSVRSGR
ncbi:hypothetical protein LguiB_014057 [Lonicera macranthoides]